MRSSCLTRTCIFQSRCKMHWPFPLEDICVHGDPCFYLVGGNQATHLSLTDSLHELKASFGSTNSKLTKRIEPIAQGDLKPAYWLSKHRDVIACTTATMVTQRRHFSNDTD
ncbi:hypothetical protein T4E_10453 [Trichinella pseudospiralis]|uniref:Uncharacterized protein n=1 Tax=Trichinella pseudospiralis TaxID=6337 RepID=A0A0V0YBT2_TRIPS|nr:hypothetical protein T4E_10453 [Trichinella pseudospiralis]